MKLEPNIDAAIRKTLVASGINFPAEPDGSISIVDYNIDAKAKTAMLSVACSRPVIEAV